MKRYLTVLVAFLLGAAVTLVGVPGLAFAETPLQPVQYVYPDSTLDEIQQAIDNGGTVYFDRFTRLALGLSAALNAPIERTQFGVFRM